MVSMRANQVKAGELPTQWRNVVGSGLEQRRYSGERESLNQQEKLDSGMGPKVRCYRSPAVQQATSRKW